MSIEVAGVVAGPVEELPRGEAAILRTDPTDGGPRDLGAHDPLAVILSRAAEARRDVERNNRALIRCGELLVRAVEAQRGTVAARLRAVCMDLRFAQVAGSAAVDGPLAELEAIVEELGR